MSELQKVIKYCAMAFAAFLAFSIITGILTGVFAVAGSVSGFGGGKNVDVTKSFDDVKSLIVDPGVGTLNLQVGTSDKVEVVAENVSDHFKVEKDFSGNLTVKGKFFFWNFLNGDGNSTKSKITIYLPADFTAENVDINAGAGNVNIETLTTKKLSLDGGAGNINGNNVKADNVELDGGVGNIDLLNSVLTDTDLDCGVGNIDIQGSMYGDNKLDCGVGDVELHLTGSKDDYRIKVDKGVGSVRINDEKLSNSDWSNNTAANSLDIDGGVGNIDINFN
jgi:hypothetical protein